MRLIHTADWQIGKVFRFVDQPTMHVLQAARLDAITAVGRLAQQHGAGAVLVAGDAFDHDGIGERTLGQPVERMRAFERVAWHLIPGNHDPHRPGGLWERLARTSGGLPANVHLHLEPAPVPIGEGAAWLLPAPLRHRPAVDPTAWMDGAPTPEGVPRIGLAHGSIREFGSQGAAAIIDPGRPESAGLAYLALGDWHGMRRVGPRCWYSGTPEPDAFDVEDGGFALLLEIGAPHEPPRIEPLRCGCFCWRRAHARLHGAADVRALEAQLRALSPELSRLLVELRVEGTLALAERALFEARIRHGIGAALCHLRLDDEDLLAAPSEDDLDAIGRAGVLRRAADRLRRQAEGAGEPGAALARAALLRLYLEQHKAPC